MDELLEQFIIEGRELVQQATDDLLVLEREPRNDARLDSAFRAIHTLKGSVGIFDLAPMGRALHAAEDLLGTAKANATIDASRLDAVLDCIGRCDEWIEHIAGTGALPSGAEAESVRLVAAMSSIASAGAPQPADHTAASWLLGFVAAERVALMEALAEADDLTLFRYSPVPDCFFLGDDPMALVRAVPGLVALRLLPQHPEPHALFDPYRCCLQIEAATAAPFADVQAVFRFVADQVEVLPATGATLAEAGLRDTSSAGDALLSTGAPETQVRVGGGVLRVTASHIDQLIHEVGELIVAKNGLDHLLQRVATIDPALSSALATARASVDRLTNEVHHRALRLRLIPLAQTFGRLPRLVRETAAIVGKAVTFETTGESVEVDKTIADALFEPLLHLLRNAVDHGIEDAGARRAAGKPEAGHITLRAERDGDMIAIEVVDDGGGVDIDRVRDTAIARGLLVPEAIDALNEADVRELLFAPGFSTARTVTDVSGRGVGLDAVRASIADMGGTVVLDSVRGRGSTFRLLLPHRVAIAPILVVRATDQRYGIPIEAIAETLRLRPGAVVPVHHGEAFVHRGRTLPLLNLGSLLAEDCPARNGGDLSILVARVGNDLVGLEVDDVEGRLDLLLRPPNGFLAATAAISGTALLGDGRVLMVLDVAELVG